MGSRHRKASLTNEFCYRVYSNSVDYNPMDILPPVSMQGNIDNCISHALGCAVEARYRKVRKWAKGPKSVWRLSLKDLQNRMQDVAGKSEGFSLHHGILAMRDCGVGLYDDYEAIHNEHTVPGLKFFLSSMDSYAFESKSLETGKSARPEKVMEFDDVVKEIKNNGPVLANFYPDLDFSHWGKESARNSVYNGMPFAEMSEADSYLVVLIGSGGEDAKEGYFIAQNSYGLNWGDDGIFKLDPGCVERVSVPMIH